MGYLFHRIIWKDVTTEHQQSINICREAETKILVCTVTVQLLNEKQCFALISGIFLEFWLLLLYRYGCAIYVFRHILTGNILQICDKYRKIEWNLWLFIISGTKCNNLAAYRKKVRAIVSCGRSLRFRILMMNGLFQLLRNNFVAEPNLLRI